MKGLFAGGMQSMPPVNLRGDAFQLILQIHFDLNMPIAEYQKMADSVAHAFLDVSGLSMLEVTA